MVVDPVGLPLMVPRCQLGHFGKYATCKPCVKFKCMRHASAALHPLGSAHHLRQMVHMDPSAVTISVVVLLLLLLLLVVRMDFVKRWQKL